MRKSKANRSLIRNDNNIATPSTLFNTLNLFSTLGFSNSSNIATVASEPPANSELIDIPIFEPIPTITHLNTVNRAIMPSAFDIPNPYKKPCHPNGFFMNKVDSNFRGNNRLPDLTNTSQSRTAYPKNLDLRIPSVTPAVRIKDIRQTPSSSFDPIVPSDYYNKRNNHKNSMTGKRTSKSWKNGKLQQSSQNNKQDSQQWQYDSPLRRLEMQQQTSNNSGTTSPPSSFTQSSLDSENNSMDTGENKNTTKEKDNASKKNAATNADVSNDDILGNLTANDIKNIEESFNIGLRQSTQDIKLKRSNESKISDKHRNRSRIL